MLCATRGLANNMLRSIVFGLLVSAYQTQASELAGKIVHVADGDTLTVLVERKQVKVRLADIDAPEAKQPFGNRAKQSLGDICHAKQATVQERGKDRYGRTVGIVICDGIDANAERVRRGMAWVYDRYARPDSPLYALQDQARKSRIGLWAEDHPNPPWKWRKMD